VVQSISDVSSVHPVEQGREESVNQNTVGNSNRGIELRLATQ
jgi:hypothetical protein